MSVMELLKVVLWLIIIGHVSCFPRPGHHVHHRIIVPHQIKTIHHTRIVKVPEHHHYYHEKEKIVHIETPKKEEHKFPTLPDDDLDEISEYEFHNNHYGGPKHNIFKKHIPTTSKYQKRVRNSRRKKET